MFDSYFCEHPVDGMILKMEKRCNAVCEIAALNRTLIKTIKRQAQTAARIKNKEGESVCGHIKTWTVTLKISRMRE
jgi:hypothetical protein